VIACRVTIDSAAVQCRLFEVPAAQAANSIQELQIESGTRINVFASAHDFSKFVKVDAAM
jgi:hypothetical protein